LTVLRPAGSGPLVLSAASENPDTTAVIELYGPHQSSGGALRQLWSKLRLRGSETAPLQASMRRAVEHRALMAIAIGDLGVANTSTTTVAALERGWTLYAHKPIRGVPMSVRATTTPVGRAWESLRKLHDHQISHGDLRAEQITVNDGTVLFGGFGRAEYGATDNQLQSDIAQLLVTTSALYDAESAVGAAIETFGKDTVLTASRRLTKSAVPKHVRQSVPNAGAIISGSRAEVMRQTGTSKIQAETITRFTRSQFIHQHRADILLRAEDCELVVGTAGAGGVGADVSRCGCGLVGLRRRGGEFVESVNCPGGQHLCRNHHPGRCRWAGA
jgi:hypothetical protein